MKNLIKEYKKWEPSKYLIPVLLIPLFLMFLIIRFSLDNDFWFLINHGSTILKKGFITIEPFTIHSGFSFIPQQWLTSVLFVTIYNTFGVRGMYVLVAICSLIIIYILYKIANIVSNSNKKSLYITFISEIALIYLGVIVTRPQIFDALIFSLEILLLELFIKKENKKYLYILPFVSLLLVNIHSSMWLMFFVLMLPYYAENIILKIKKKKTFELKPLIIVTAISLIVGLINPYGIKAITYLFGSYGIKEINDYVNEMQGVIITSRQGFVIFMLIFAMLYSFYHNKGKNKLRYFFLTLGIGYLSLKHYRGALFLVIVFTLVLGYNFRSTKKLKEQKLTNKNKILFIILTLIIILVGLFNSKEMVVYNNGLERIADYLDNNATKDIKLYTNYGHGNYMEYRGYKCYIDARAEVFLKANNKKANIFHEYYKLVSGKIKPKKFVDKYAFDYLLVDLTKDKTLSVYLDMSDNYTRVYQIRNAYLYKKK